MPSDKDKQISKDSEKKDNSSIEDQPIKEDKHIETNPNTNISRPTTDTTQSTDQEKNEKIDRPTATTTTKPGISTIKSIINDNPSSNVTTVDSGTTTATSTATVTAESSGIKGDKSKNSSLTSMRDHILFKLGLNDKTEDISDTILQNYLTFETHRLNKEAEDIRHKNLELLQKSIEFISSSGFSNDSLNKLLDFIDPYRVTGSRTSTTAAEYAPQLGSPLSKRRRLDQDPSRNQQSLLHEYASNVNVSPSFTATNSQRPSRQNSISASNAFPIQQRPATASSVLQQPQTFIPLNSNTSPYLHPQQPYMTTYSPVQGTSANLAATGNTSQASTIQGQKYFTPTTAPAGNQVGQPIMVLAPGFNQTQNPQPTYIQQLPYQQGQLQPQQQQQQYLRPGIANQPLSYSIPVDATQRNRNMGHRRSYSTNVLPQSTTSSNINPNISSRSPGRMTQISPQRPMNFLIHTPKHPPPK
ncbi:hypothetical protein TBLA_0G02560 [Henningerozyma blattae CBS 6284]|uniref:Uncharacterized protein n=1 Tax=Henningerozyma blattae (strain ATCC 34711 / CBS 6284 / DSM 70876 / NBRC 10599 / NRRL Y-10934 / UCD 77-7) TaxID=1071380 RepID=I2H742_HENB6|nr:hypothetical protein TBLA_0G02560 [Tetrapisispora blattae CBS 6284]CCH62194.1 hypothetical protein TBLA_0G02560 [Tetrapisispora blattae CBS 6284]